MSFNKDYGKYTAMADTRQANKYTNSQLLNFVENSYLERTSRPIYAIAFLLIFIILYEVGTIALSTETLNQSQVRVVSFVWLQNMLEYIGFGGKMTWIAPPMVVVVLLLAFQISSKKSWHVEMMDTWPMHIECMLLAVPLIVLSLFINSSSTPEPNQVAAICAQTNGAQTHYSLLTDIITGVGAGIYEELLFRLILIVVLMMLFQNVLKLSHKTSIILSVCISALLFSAHHHINFADGQFSMTAPFNWTAFIFRAMAGAYFAVLFAVRGFGITAGTHAWYDIIATVINSAFFAEQN